MKAPLLVGAIALSMFVGGCASQPSSTSEPQPPSPSSSSEAESSQQSATATPSTGQPTQEAATGNLATPAIEANQSDEQMALDLLASLTSWHMAGATPEAKAVRSSRYGHLTLEAYAEKIANEQMVHYAPKLFGRDYAANALLSIKANGYREANKINVLLYLQTSGTTNPANKEPYTRSLVLDDFTSLPTAGADKSLSINYHEIDNSDKNSVGGGGVSDVHGNKGNITLSFKAVDGFMVITIMKSTAV